MKRILLIAFFAMSFFARAEDKPIRVVVWDEQQPAQTQAYKNFLGNQIADNLKRLGFTVTSVRMDDPEQGLSKETLDNCDVLVWWGHIRNRQVTKEHGKEIVDRIKSGQLSLIALHSAHWCEPFIQAMWERTKVDAEAKLTDEERKTVKIKYIEPKLAAPKKDSPLTPSFDRKKDADGSDILEVTLPLCVFPGWRADGAPGHLTTLLPDHPIAKGIPKTFDVPQTEMYDEPFHVPAPDELVFEEKWDKGEHFRSGMVWKLGKGKVFYFRPGHEIYGVYMQPVPLQIIANAVKWLGTK